jgi:hypothetical protein
MIADELPEGMVGLRHLDIEWTDGKLSGYVYGIARELMPFSHEMAAKMLVRQALEHTKYPDTAVEVVWSRCIIAWDDKIGQPEIPEIHAKFKSIERLTVTDTKRKDGETEDGDGRDETVQ